MKKRMTVLLIALALVITVMPAPVFGASASLEDKAVYYTPASDYKSGDCILTASKMMIRRACIIKGRGDWTKITNKSLRSVATTLGLLLNTFKVDTEGLVYKVECGYFNGNGESLSGQLNNMERYVNARSQAADRAAPAAKARR